ncbi:MAG: nuclease-related domain-containing protein [Angelakisella sp.]
MLENVTLGTGDQAATVDQLVVGPFGMLVACDVHQKGSIYGDLDAREWILTTGSEGNEKKSRIPSPYFAATRFVELLRPLLAERKIYSLPVEIVLPKTQRQESFVNGGATLFFTLKELKDYINKTKFDKDVGVDIGKVVELFSK